MNYNMKDLVMYHCAICGKPYETVEERAECEAKCIAERKAAEELKNAQERELKRRESAAKIFEALDNAEGLLKEHFKNYQKLTMNKDYPNLKALFDHRFWWF